MSEGDRYTLTFSLNFERVIRHLKKKKPDLVRELTAHFAKLVREPEIGKPLRHTLRNYRRVHVKGSFVLLYEIRAREVRLIDFDHHDRVYKKHNSS